MSHLVNQNHPLIKREQTYFLDRKLVSVHNVDRDINKWPNPSHFEIELPENLLNVSSLRLVNSYIPSNIYTFTNDYQNTKFCFTIQEDISGTSAEKTHIDLFESGGNSFTVEIDEGFYTPVELANELQAKLNRNVTETLQAFPPGLPSSYIYSHFRVKYNSTQHKLYIINLRDGFTLQFDKQITYDGVSCGQKTVFGQYSNWGLPYNLGFNKQQYDISNGVPDLSFYYDSTVYGPDPSSNGGVVRFAASEDSMDIATSGPIYVELDKYNSMDELDPYVNNTMALFNNDYTGRTNSAFAKIPVLSDPFAHNYESKNALSNITFFKTPIPKIRTLKFKIRHHDGRLVDFKRMPFSFTIEANQLIDEQPRNYVVHAPYVYNL
jgi:hypothetical protein